jgi:double-stranded uracil-DNA glycosylase
MGFYRPSRSEIQAARDKLVPDLIAPGLKVLFVGINPGLYTAAIGHHFGRPGNRFWPALHAAGITDRLLSPFEERELLKLGYGITNFVNRATATADELLQEELVEGGRTLLEKAIRYQPKAMAVLGIGAYRTAFGTLTTQLGLQEETIGGVKLWVLPNPSGLNAHYRLQDLTQMFRELRQAVEG